MFKRVQSRDQLIEYALRKLGAPVIQVNVAQEQLEDRVNDALHMFFRYHMDGTTREVITISITEEMLEKKAITLDPSIIGVIDVVASPTRVFSMDNLQYKMYFSDLISKSFTGSAMSSYTITRSYLSTLSQVMGDVYYVTSFNLHGNEVKIAFDWSKLQVGSLVGLDVYKIVNPEYVYDVWDNYWLKEYTTALVKEQWGTNLMKYNGPSLPGGGTLNGVEIYQSALQDIQKLEDRLYNEFQMPIMGFMA